MSAIATPLLNPTRTTKVVVAVLVIGLFLLPVPVLADVELGGINTSLLFSFTQMFMLVTLTSNWNLTSGMMGYVDFGHPVFFGLGAYGTGIMMNKLAWSFPTALLVGVVAAGVFAVLIGMPTLRLRGPYFSIAMLGTFVAMREIVRVSKPLTGGGEGLTLPPYLNRPLFYYLTLTLAVGVVSLMWWIRRSQFGSTLIAIREDEVGAEMRGVPTTLHKIAAFALAGTLSGIVGGLWAYQNTFIDPDVVFFEPRVVELVMMGILGGLGTVAGPVIGAATLFWLRDVLWANFLQFHLLLQGVLLILLVLYAPTGILGFFGVRGIPRLSRLLRRGTDDTTDPPGAARAHAPADGGST